MCRLSKAVETMVRSWIVKSRYPVLSGSWIKLDQFADAAGKYCYDPKSIRTVTVSRDRLVRLTSMMDILDEESPLSRAQRD